MEKLAAGAPVHLAQVKVQVTLPGRWFQAQAPLQTLQVVLEGDRGGFSGDFAKLLAYLQSVPDQGQSLRLSAAQRRQGGLAQLVEAGSREISDGSQRVRHSGRLDDVGWRGIEVFGAQQTGDEGEPAGGDGPLGAAPEVLVVAGGGYAGAVAGAVRETSCSPGEPGGRSLPPLQTLEKSVVGLDGMVFEAQRGRVPGPAHDGYVLVALLEGLAYLTPHVRFAAGFERRGAGNFPPHGHRFDDGVEEVGGVAALVDLALPPQLAVLVSGGFGEETDRVLPNLGLRTVLIFELQRARQVHEPRRHAAPERVAERVPLRRKAGERVVGGVLWGVRRVDEQGDGRPHLGTGHQRQYGICIGRPFDEDGVRAQLIEGPEEAPRAAGAVVSDAEDPDRHGYTTSRHSR